MDTVRLGILIWLILPVPIYWLIRRWYFAQIRKYPSTASGRIVSANVSYYRYVADDPGRTNVTYVFDVAGTEYRGQFTLHGTNHKLDKEIPIRYNPERPEESRLDNLRDWVRFWAVQGVIVFGIDFGLALFLISLGLLLLFAGIKLLIRRRLPWQHWVLSSSPILASLPFILLGLVFIPVGVSFLIVYGFLGQNLLWELWNH